MLKQLFEADCQYSLTVKLLTEHHLEFLSLRVDCTGSSEFVHDSTGGESRTCNPSILEKETLCAAKCTIVCIDFENTNHCVIISYRCLFWMF